jgi:uncharacterized membrane protein
MSSTQPEVASLPLQSEQPNSDLAPLQKQHVSPSLAKTESEQQLESLLSNLLKYGVLTASAVVLLGGILYLIRHGAEPVQYHVFRGEPSQLCSPAGVLEAVLSGSRRGIIQLGLLLLIATPVLRVVISLVVFLRSRNFHYVIVTFLVLTALIYSLVGAYF